MSSQAYENAIPYLKQILTLDPEYADAYFLLGIAERRSNG